MTRKLFISLTILLSACGLVICVTSCGLLMVMGPGTHGSIKGYKYPVTKAELEKAVSKVIENNSNIHTDTQKNYWNDGERYLQLTIKSSGTENQYTLHYYGDTIYWRTSPTSQISIIHAKDKFGKGGDEGHRKIRRSIKRQLTDVFEREFISKLDSILNKRHTADF